MNTNQLSFSKYNQSQNMPDLVDEFLSPLLSDFPEALSTQSRNMPDPVDDFLPPLLFDFPQALPTLTPTPTYTSPPAPAPAPDPLPTPHPHLTCNWITRSQPPLVCGAPLSPDPKHVCAHFRLAHEVRGNDKVTVRCLWYACRAPPMQRGSVIRHILTVHLKLLRWQCEACGKVFSRRGTEHVCQGGR